MKIIAIGALALLVALCLMVFFQIKVDASKAVEYSIIKTQDMSIPGRERWQQFIVAPSATNTEQLAHTVKRAALKLRKHKSADTITIFLEPSSDRIALAESLARVNYIPDGKGYSGTDSTPVWNVEVLEPPFDWHNGMKIYEKRDY